MLMKDRVVLITGASRGIGAAAAKLLARHGASVGVNYFQSGEAAAAIVAEIGAQGGRAIPVRADVRDPAQVEEMFRRVREAFGPVDTLVANASISFPMVPFLQVRWEDFQAKLLGELGAAFACAKAAVPDMAQGRSGCILFVSSGLSRHPGFGFCAHSTAKSGLDAFAKSLAMELGPMGIRVNVIAPGLTLTDATAMLPQDRKDAMARMTPMGRNGLPEDVAGAILALAMGEAGFVTGAYLPVSGGIQMP